MFQLIKKCFERRSTNSGNEPRSPPNRRPNSDNELEIPIDFGNEPESPFNSDDEPESRFSSDDEPEIPFDSDNELEIPPNSNNEPQAVFHRFSQLPQEIQNMIWAYVLCVDAPRAYFVDVRKLSDNPRMLEMAHSIPVSLGSFPPLPSNPGGDYDLMRVCRASYQEITRCWTSYRPQVPARMILDNSHDKSRRMKEISGLDIDAASDLVFVEGWCHDSGRLSGIQGADNYWPEWKYMAYDGLRGIRRVAIPVDQNLDYADHSRYLACLKAVFPDIKTLYFFMQPAQLVPHMWRRKGRWFSVDLLITDPWANEEPPESFRARGRTFYEVDFWDMERAGIDLEDYVEPWLRKRWRWKRNGIPCIKFMTWKWIQ